VQRCNPSRDLKCLSHTLRCTKINALSARSSRWRSTTSALRQITGRIVRNDPKNGNDDDGIVVLPADPRLLDMAQRILGEVPPACRQPLVIREAPAGSTSIRSPDDDAGFVPRQRR
jgi:hypothetical protein